MTANGLTIKTLVLPLLVALTFLYSLFGVLKPVPEPVSDEVWETVESAIGPHTKDGDVVIVHPAWEDSVLTYFKNQFIILGKPNTKAYKAIPRIWLILTHGAPMPDYLENDKTYVRDFELELSGLKIFRYIMPDASDVIYDFYSSIKNAKASLIKGTVVKPCDKFKLMRWMCPANEWNYFGWRNVKIHAQYESAIWFHPKAGWITRAEYANVPLGDVITGEYALTDDAINFSKGRPVTLKVFIDGELAGEYVTKPVYGWHSFEIDTKQLNKKKGRVVFESTVQQDGKRHFCFRAQVRSKSPGRK